MRAKPTPSLLLLPHASSTSAILWARCQRLGLPTLSQGPSPSTTTSSHQFSSTFPGRPASSFLARYTHRTCLSSPSLFLPAASFSSSSPLLALQRWLQNPFFYCIPETSPPSGCWTQSPHRWRRIVPVSILGEGKTVTLTIMISRGAHTCDGNRKNCYWLLLYTKIITRELHHKQIPVGCHHVIAQTMRKRI